MTDEHATLVAAYERELAQNVGQPATPELATVRVLLATAALGPLARLVNGPNDSAEWLSPLAVDALERIGTAMDELYDELITADDDVTILEPGTLGQQNFTDMNVTGPSAPKLGRGELIR